MSSHSIELNTSTRSASPDIWQCGSSAGTGCTEVRILGAGLNNFESKFYLSVTAGKNVGADPSLKYTLHVA